MLIAIDIGNSRAKAGVFVEDSLEKVFTNLSEFELVSLVNQYPDYSIFLSSVVKIPPHFFNLLQRKERLLVVDHETDVPIKNCYHSPKTLGIDRLVASIGAWSLYAHVNTLVIDIGTCVTYDFISDNGEYLGGGISPGLKLRAKSLNAYTQKLPLIEDLELIPDLIGKTTETSIQSGIVLGLCHEIEGFIKTFENKFSQLQTVLTGGDAVFFESMIKASIFVNPNLVLHGLHSIFKHNGSI
ncbi:MAG: type III pantothenate kinase [Cytophagales bacterium]